MVKNQNLSKILSFIHFINYYFFIFYLEIKINFSFMVFTCLVRKNQYYLNYYFIMVKVGVQVIEINHHLINLHFYFIF